MKLEGLGAASIEPLKDGPEEPQCRRSGSSPPRRWPTSTIPRESTLSARPPSRIQNFRVYALAALAALDQPASHLKLRKLMDEPEIELRYGAFNALRTLDPHDPFLGQVRVLDEPKPETDDDEPVGLDGGGHHQCVSPPQSHAGRSVRPLRRRLGRPAA